MKKIQILAAILVIAASAMAAMARPGEKLVISVGFDFQIGDKQFAAGQYTVKQLETNVFFVRSADKKRQAIVTTTLTNKTNNGKEGARFIFHRYGEKYFMAEIYTETASLAHLLYKSDDERRAEKEQERLTQNPKPENVVVRAE